MKRLHDLMTTIVLMSSGGLLIAGNGLASSYPEASLYSLSVGAIGLIVGGELVRMRNKVKIK